MLITAEVAPASTVRVVSPLVICPGLLLDMKFTVNFPLYWSLRYKSRLLLGSRTVSDVTENDRSMPDVRILAMLNFNLRGNLSILHVEFEVSTIYPFAWSHSVQIW